MASGVYVPNFEDVLETALALNWGAEDLNWALYNATRATSVDFNTESAYTTTNEIVGTGYTAGGKVVLGTAFSRPGGGVLRYSSDAVQWDNSTLTGVRFIDMYAPVVAGDPLMFGIDLVIGYNTSDGTLLVTPHANGLLTADLVP